MKRLILLCMLLLGGSIYLAAQSFDYSKIAPHPRLLLPEGGEEVIRESIEKHPALARVHRQILRVADRSMNEPPMERIMEGKRLLGISRKAMTRIFYLAYAYRLTAERKYAERAEKEMLAVSRFSDWNPSHFLDVGEMTLALAIGYDWLYGQLQPDTRHIVEKAIAEKAFAPSKVKKYTWFYNSKNNWNSVCNSGLVHGALAIYETMPEEAQTIIKKCMQTNPKAMSGYAPDGGYPEGFGYWGYGTSFQALLIAALESALGSDGGLSKAPGFLESARFMEFMTAPSGSCFSFSDSPVRAYANMIMYWFARKQQDPSLLWVERQFLEGENLRFGEDRLLPILMIYGAQFDLTGLQPPSSLTWFSRGDTPVYIHRSGWTSPEDTYLGVKGGTASTSHAHMDAGSFVYECGGARWSTDLGVQEYYPLESKGVDLWNLNQNSQRWQVFRLGSSAHSTLTLDGANHNVKGFADLAPLKKQAGVKVDLTSTLGEKIEKALRTFTLKGLHTLEVTDEVKNGAEPTVLRWTMCTPATPTVKGNRMILLAQNGKQLALRVSSPRKVTLKTWKNDPVHDYDEPNPGTCRVGYELKLLPHEKITIKVHLSLKD